MRSKGILTPTLSPDGERVAFVALNDLWVMRIGQSPRRITNDSAYQTDPAWSPNGRYIAYSSDKAGTQDLYVHDTQTGTDRRVTSLDGDAAISTTSNIVKRCHPAIVSGARFFAIGELIDRSRVYYNSQRPTTSIEQIPVELSRAHELDYDFVKTYVRLNAKRMAKVTDIAHERGVPAESHYLCTWCLRWPRWDNASIRDPAPRLCPHGVSDKPNL